MAVIAARDVWKRFGPKEVLKGLNLEVHEGETLVILGRSGVGKSVLLKQIIGIDRPDSGSVEVNGILISDLRGRKLYRAIRNMGMLFQGAALFDSLTVGQNTAFYLDQHGDPATGKPLPREEIRQRVAQALEMVDLAGTEELTPSSLSGGMKKRAALARLIVYRPKVLLYDEPTTGLDPVTTTHINELIKRTQQELNATSIVVTHDVRSAMDVGDRLALHHDGQIVFVGSPEEFVRQDHPVIRSFLENTSFSPMGAA
jgi:phospholipid/cholesterol/gamma-HCH transport system ATP-binding protein